MKTATAARNCDICGGEIEIESSGWSEGHNADPVVDGRCCSTCNTTVVIPDRLSRIYGLQRDSR